MPVTRNLPHPFFGQLLLPLQGVVNFFSPPVPVIAAKPAQPYAAPRPPAKGTALVSQQFMGLLPQAAAAQVLRSRRTQDGRIVISGRMRDVCAELDRLCGEPA